MGRIIKTVLFTVIATILLLVLICCGDRGIDNVGDTSSITLQN